MSNLPYEYTHFIKIHNFDLTDGDRIYQLLYMIYSEIETFLNSL